MLSDEREVNVSPSYVWNSTTQPLEFKTCVRLYGHNVVFSQSQMLLHVDIHYATGLAHLNRGGPFILNYS